MRQLTSDLKLGVEWNPLADEVGVVANWRALRETPARPALIIGTSSDRIGTPSGQSYFATISKGFLIRDVGVAPYAGVSYSGYENRWLFPFGLSAVAGAWNGMILNDGVHTHLSVTRSFARFSATLLAVERRDLGVTLGARF